MAKILPATQEFLRRHWRRALKIRERLRFSEEAVHLVLAGCVGVIGALINFAFYTSIEWVQMTIFGHQGDMVEVAEVLPQWQRFIFPAFGALAAGLVLFGGLRFIGKQGSANLLEVVVVGDGRLPFRSALVKAVSSLMSIGTGASIGREGAITQLSATLASKWGQLARWEPYRLRLLVACGAASGIAAAYNAPVAGAVFAAHIVLGNFSMSLFAPLVFASVIAAVMSRTFFGIEPWYIVPSFDFTSVVQLPWFLVLGIIAGGVGASFQKLLKLSEDLFRKTRWPIYAQLGLGGVLVGLLAIWQPGVWGNGYAITSRILLGEAQGLHLLVGLLLAKVIATTVTVGSGAVGGVLTPTLFIGAASGALFGTVLHQVGWASVIPTGAFALIGMGSVLAATTRAPLLAMILMLEISLNYSLMPALMLGCVLSTLTARKLYPESIYTEPMRLRGLVMDRENDQLGTATERTVGDMMRAPVVPVRENTTFQEIANRFLSSPNNFLPVVDADGALMGIVALQDMKEYLAAGSELSAVIAYDIMRSSPPCLTPNQRLLEAFPVLLKSEQRNVPVVNNLKENKLIGAVGRAEALGILSEAIASKSSARSD